MSEQCTPCQAKKSTLEYFNGDELAASVWMNKYALKDSDGNIFEETPWDMHHRLATEFARIEWEYPNPMGYGEIFELLDNFKYVVPQGSPMFGIGNELQTVSLSNCFVVGNTHDSYGGILQTEQEQIQLMKRRGGVGHDLSHIRASGAKVNNSALTSTGVVPFMERYSNATREVAQDGRRGALMLSISSEHPNALDFASAKLEDDKITGANISIKASDRFMHSVITPISVVADGNFVRHPTQMAKDKKLWDTVIHNSWLKAEPAFLFWDTIIRESIPSCYGGEWRETSTNPCGEIPLCPYDSCRLMAMNLYSYVENPFTTESYFNFIKYESHVGKAQRLMDDMVDLEIEKIDKILLKIESDEEPEDVKNVERQLWEKIREKAVDGRRTGLGITAAGDTLAALGIRYGSDEGTEMLEAIMNEHRNSAYDSSEELAKERGHFPVYNREKEAKNPFIQRVGSTEPRRNISMLTIAPTGTTSLMTQTSSGIEPVFQVAHKRKRKINHREEGQGDSIDQNGDHWRHYNVLHHHFVTWYMEYIKHGGRSYGYSLEREEAKKHLEGMPEDELKSLIKKSPYRKATAHDIDPIAKVKMQGAIQKYIDHSISVTVNLPKEATEELVEQVYIEAYNAGCKGVTVYRDGSRSGVLVTNEEEENPIIDNNAPRRPKRLPAQVIEFQNNKEKWVAFVGMYHERPYEIFVGKLHESLVEFTKTKKDVSIVKTKDDKGIKKYHAVYNGTKIEISNVFNKEYWNYAKFISGLLRHGTPLQYVYEIVKSMNMEDDHLNSWKSGVSRVIKRFISNGVKSKDKCGNCGAEDSMEFAEGCEVCKSCGSSKCG